MAYPDLDFLSVEKILLMPIWSAKSSYRLCAMLTPLVTIQIFPQLKPRGSS